LPWAAEVSPRRIRIWTLSGASFSAWSKSAAARVYWLRKRARQQATVGEGHDVPRIAADCRVVVAQRIGDVAQRVIGGGAAEHEFRIRLMDVDHR
jgi:hypothetical protein